jgi:hypothetical protein
MLTSRVDVLSGVTASYSYDVLNRLISEVRSGGSLPSAQTIAWSYNPIGNLLTRTEGGDVNTYTTTPAAWAACGHMQWRASAAMSTTRSFPSMRTTPTATSVPRCAFDDLDKLRQGRTP